MKITKATRWRICRRMDPEPYLCHRIFSLFALPLTTRFGWSLTLNSAWPIRFICLSTVPLDFLGGLLAEKLSAQVAIYLGLAFCSRMVFDGFASSIPQLYLFYGIFAGAVSRHHLSGLSSYGFKMVS